MPTVSTLRATQPVHRAIVVWGVAGSALMLANALRRVVPIALEPLAMDLAAWQLALYWGWAGVNTVVEGHRGFARRVTPRVLGRALWLAHNPTPRDLALAPLFCMSLYGARRPALIARYVLIAGLVALVMGMKFVPQPWRGIVDAGVVAGLGYGLMSMLVGLANVLAGGSVPMPADLEPARAAAATVPSARTVTASAVANEAAQVAE